jgi:type II secretory pathway component PulF
VKTVPAGAAAMIEPLMYFGIGFLVATLFALVFFPIVHNRAIRLTTRRLEAA